MAFSKLTGGLIMKVDPRQLSVSDLVRATNVEMRAGYEGLMVTNTYVNAGILTAAAGGALKTAGLIYAYYDSSGGLLIADHDQTLYEAPVAVSGISGTQVNLYPDGTPLQFSEPLATLGGMMLNERLYVITGSPLSTGDGIEYRNLVREPNGHWRREGLAKPTGDYTTVALADITILSSPVTTPYTYRAKYRSDLMDTASKNHTFDGRLVNDGDDTTAAKIEVVVSGNSHTAIWDFSNLAKTGQDTGTQPATGVGVLRLLVAGGPRAAWPLLAVPGGASNYSLDDDIVIMYSTTGVSGAYTTLATRKGPFIAEWFTKDFEDTVITLSNLVIKIQVTKNSGSKDATAFIAAIRFDVGGGDSATVNTETTDGIHYLLTLYSDPTVGGTGRESAPGDFGSAILFPENGTIEDYAKLDPIPTSYPGGIRSISFPLPPGADQDPDATHYRIYRSSDGTKASVLDHYGLIDQVLIDRNTTSQTYTDNFLTFPITEVPQPTLPCYFTGTDPNVVFYPLNELPPIPKAQCVYKGSRIMVKDGDTDIFFTHPFDWEAVPGLYRISSRSPRNDQPETVASLMESWFIFYHDYTRRVQGLPLILDGQFDGTNYAETNEYRGACSPEAVCTLTQNGDEGNAVLFCVDRLGFYVRNESEIKPWSKNIIWADPLNSLSLASSSREDLRQVRVRNNPKIERVEIYYLPNGGDGLTWSRLDVYYNRPREDGMPMVLGPHNVGRLSRVLHATDDLGQFRSWAQPAYGYGDTDGTSIYMTGEGVLSRYGVPVERAVETGYIQIGGESGKETYVKYVDVLTGSSTNPAQVYTEWAFSRVGYEDTYAPIIFDPAQPARIGVWCRGEYLNIHIQDSTGGSTAVDRPEILGLGIFPGRGIVGESSAQRGKLGRAFNTTTKLKGF
jgi:hypothetical protein